MREAVAAVLQVPLASARTESDSPGNPQITFVNEVGQFGDARFTTLLETMGFGVGTPTAHGTDEYTTTEPLVRNAFGEGTHSVLYEQRRSTDQ